MSNKKEKPIEEDALSLALEKIAKDLGKGMVIGGTEVIYTERVYSGSLGIDIITGGGYGEGKITLLTGPSGGGKTTTALIAMKEAQEKEPEKKVLFLDFEKAFSLERAEALGIDPSKLLFSQPDTAETGMEILERLVTSGGISLAVVDSVAGMLPEKELQGEMGDSSMGIIAKLMSQVMRKLPGAANKTKTTVIFINQEREKIGVMFGSPITYPGGKALEFYSSQWLEIRRSSEIKDGEEIIGNRTKVKVKKNRFGAPFKTCEFDLLFDQGISKIGEILDYAEVLKIINKSGSWYSYGGTKLGQGRNGVIELLQDNPEICEELEKKVKEHYGI